MSADPKAWLWFLSSYGPLWFILALRFEPLWLRALLVFLGLGSVFLVGRLLYRRHDELPSSASIRVAGDAGAEVGGYLATYLLPFLTAADPSWRDLLAYLLFIVVAGLVYTRSTLMQINPTVYFFGHRVLRGAVGRDDRVTEVFVITKRSVTPGTMVRGERFSEQVFVEHTQERR